MSDISDLRFLTDRAKIIDALQFIIEIWLENFNDPQLEPHLQI